MNAKLKKSSGVKITLSYFGNVSNKFGLVQKQSTFIEDKNAIQLYSYSEKKKIQKSLDKGINKIKKNQYNFRPINIKDFDSTNNINFFNFVKNYSNLERINTSKRITSFKRPESSRPIFLRNKKEASKSDFNENNKSNNKNSCTTITNDLKYSKAYKDSLMYFVNIKKRKLKKKKKFEKINKNLNFSEENVTTKCSKFLMDEFLRYKREHKDNINESVNNTHKEIKKKPINIFNNKLIRSKVKYFYPEKIELMKLKELINENGIHSQENNSKKKYFKNINRKLFSRKFSTINRKNSKIRDVSTNTEFLSFIGKNN